MPVFFDFETLIARRGRPRTFTRFFELGAVCLRSDRVISALVDPLPEWDITDVSSLVSALYDAGMNPRPSVRFWGRTLKRKSHPYFVSRHKHYFKDRKSLSPVPFLDSASDLVYAYSLADTLVRSRDLVHTGADSDECLSTSSDVLCDLRDLAHEEGDKTLVAHNGRSFDFHVMRGSASRCGLGSGYFDGLHLVDSIPVFRKAIPKLKSYSQPFLYSTIFGEQYDAHIAIDDALALRRIWNFAVPEDWAADCAKKSIVSSTKRPKKPAVRAVRPKEDRPVIVLENPVPPDNRVTIIPGIGPATARSLAQLKIHTVPQLRRLWMCRKARGQSLKGVVRFWRKVETYLESMDSDDTKAKDNKELSEVLSKPV